MPATDPTDYPLEQGLRRARAFAICVLVAGAGTYLAYTASSLTPAATRALFILLLSATLWLSDTIPAYSVGILVIALKIALLGRPDGVFAKSSKDWEQFVMVLGHPLVWLFFGGFVLAAGMSHCGLDRLLAKGLLKRVGTKPKAVLLGMMGVTFVLSMFMSNTATTAMMLAIVTQLGSDPSGEPTEGKQHDRRYSVGLLVGTAVAANLGGVASLIGTPPNAIAVGALDELNPSLNISFLDWMLIGLPPACVCLMLAWLLVSWWYPSKRTSIHFASSSASELHLPVAPRWQLIVVAVTLVATFAGWLTSSLHGIPAAAIALLPIVVFTASGLLSIQEIRNLPWEVLFLLAGGLALGQAVTETGLSAWIVAQLPLSSLPPLAIGCVMGYVTVLMSNFMSNTAAANVLVPIGVALSAGFEANVAVTIAFGASAAMCLPVATPPNAIVCSTGLCRTRDFLQIGLVIGVVLPALGMAWSWIILPVLL